MRGFKAKRPVYLAIAAVFITSLISYNLLVKLPPKASAAATVDTSTSATATATSDQRKTFYDATTSLYWAFYNNGTAIAYANSSNGTSWTNRGTLAVNPVTFSVTAASGVVYLVYGVTLSPPQAEKGTLGTTSITWSGLTALSANNTFGSAVNLIALDSNGRIWVVYTTAVGTNKTMSTQRSINVGDTTSWGAAQTLANGSSTTTIFAEDIVPMTTAGNMLFMTYTQTTLATNLNYVLYTDATTSYSASTSFEAFSGGAGMLNVVAGPGDTAYAAYTTGGNVSFVEYSGGSWGSSVVLDSSGADSTPNISITAGGSLYVFWINANAIEYVKGVSPFSSGSWDASPTIFYNTGTNASMTSSYAQGNSTIQLLWTQGTGSPFNVEFGTLTPASNSVPAAPTLLAPASGATAVSQNPLFQLRTTDADSDYLEYKVLVYASDCSSGVQTFDQTVSQAGWALQNQNSGTAYTGAATITSSTIANFGLVGLSANTTYCWKAAAIDPGGSNTFSGFSGTQLFTTGPTNPGTVNINGGATINGGSIVR